MTLRIHISDIYSVYVLIFGPTLKTAFFFVCCHPLYFATALPIVYPICAIFLLNKS
jgi:hypothetical protein